MNKSFFIADKVSFSYFKKPLCLNGVSFCMEKFDKVLLLSTKEMGKTTFLSVMSSFEDNYFGNIFFSDKNLKDISDEEKKFSFLPSTPVLFDNKRVFDNLNIINEKNTANIDEILKKYELHEYKNLKVKKLSLLQKRIVAIARSEVKNPNILFLDDQFDGLSDEEIKIMSKVIETVLNDEKKTVIFAISNITYSFLKEFLLKFNFAKILYLVDSNMHEFKDLKAFEEILININQISFFNEYKNILKAILYKENDKYFIQFDEQILDLPSDYNKEFIGLNLNNGDEEDIIILSKGKIDLMKIDSVNFNEKIKLKELLIFSSIDGSRLL